MGGGLFFLLDSAWWQSVSGFVFSEYGLLGFFLLSIATNATILLPVVPMDVLVFLVSSLATNPFAAILVGVVGGSGAAIGELSGYFVGALGIKSYEKITKKEVVFVTDIKAKIKDNGAWVIFFGAVLPFPFDVIGVAAGLIKYRLRNFFIAAFAGKTIRYSITALAGYYGVQLVKMFFLGG